MNKYTIPEYIPENKLNRFKSYKDFLAYCRSMFDMEPEEYKRLFDVLVKLQSVGRDPMETLRLCKYQMGDMDCLDMLKLMIQINEMDLDELNALT